MKPSLEQNKVSLSTTAEAKSKLQIKENNHLFNQIGKLAVDHDVTVSNTMIKVTYKKALKDQNSVESILECSTDSDFQNGKNNSTESTNLCSSDISFIVKSPKLETVGHKVIHSTPKPSETDTEKTRKYVNGINLSDKPSSFVGTSSAAKVQKTPSSQENSSSSPKKPKAILNKQTSKLELDKMFLKGNGLVKPKTSIIQKSVGDCKKMKLGKSGDKRIKKLENGVKNKTGVDKKTIKGVKHNASNTELDFVKHKKMKVNDSKSKRTEGSHGSYEINKSGSKKKIMLVDPDLPTGWTRFIRTKNKGSPNEQYVVYVVNPQGKKFRFKWKLRKFLQRTNSSLDVDQFFFGLYQRPKTSNVSTSEKDQKTKMNAATVRGDGSSGDLNDVDSELSPGPYESSTNQNRSSNGKEILFFDPDLPFGWKRIIHSNRSNGRKQVHIISPDGKIFRRRYRLNEYLVKHQYTHNLDRFYFGLYPKKEGNSLEMLWKRPAEKTPNLVRFYKSDKCNIDPDSENDIHEFTGDLPNSPMYDDPNLPQGWKRFIKIRSCGETAGRMEVVIVSPDGRKMRTRKHLEHYLKQKQLSHKPEDFDFSVFGRSNLKNEPSSGGEPNMEPEPGAEQELPSNDVTFFVMKKKFDKPVPELDINSLKEPVITPEGRLINSVTGLMLSSNLSSSRNERRQKLPRREHEKQLKNYLSAETELSFDGGQIPAQWVQRLVKCRGDFKILELDAAATLAETTKEFIKKVSLQALTNSEQPENGLRYEDIAEVIDATEGLAFLKTLIPKKITFKEYVKLNRPNKFLSFT